MREAAVFKRESERKKQCDCECKSEYESECESDCEDVQNGMRMTMDTPRSEWTEK